MQETLIFNNVRFLTGNDLEDAVRLTHIVLNQFNMGHIVFNLRTVFHRLNAIWVKRTGLDPDPCFDDPVSHCFVTTG